MLRSKIVGLWWVCDCCMLIHANGECGDHEHEHEPLSLIPDGHSVTMGLLYEDHDDSCTDRESGECGCDRKEFTWSRCDGCGSPDGGSRHALTLWDDRTA